MKKQWWMREAPDWARRWGKETYWFKGYYDAVGMVVTFIALSFLAAVVAVALLMIVYP